MIILYEHKTPFIEILLFLLMEKDRFAFEFLQCYTYILYFQSIKSLSRIIAEFLYDFTIKKNNLPSAM